MNSLTDRLNASGIRLIQMFTGTENLQNLTHEQVSFILSLQNHVKIEDDEICILKKKKGGGKANLDKLRERFYTQKKFVQKDTEETKPIFYGR